MKSLSSISAAALIATGWLLTGCGGGGDEAGSPTAFSVSPDTSTVTWTSVAGLACGPTLVGTFFVYGGTAPYRLDNSNPGEVTLSSPTVGQRGGSFTASFVGGCVDPAIVTIVDSLNHVITLKLINKAVKST